MIEPDAFAVTTSFDPEPLTTHRFARHYLLYAQEGLMRIEAQGRCWLLPPARAAWIAADEPVQISIVRRIRCCSVLFAPAVFGAPAQALRVFDMTPLLREVLLELRAFGPATPEQPPHARQLFELAATLAERQSANPSQAWMPQPRTDAMRRALERTKQGLADDLDFSVVADAAGLTPRTLARRFADEMGMTWRQTMRKLRMIAAMEHLLDPDCQVTEAAFASGYSSLSAFNTAFRDFTGLSPSDYRAGLRSA